MKTFLCSLNLLKIYLKSVLLLSVLSCLQLAAQTPVYVSGTEGHKSYRIPAIIKNTQGELLAFAEGRVKGSGDFGDINIVLKKSTDGGKIWGQMITVVDYDDLQAGNPAPVLDNSDPQFPKGRIFLFYNTGNNHEGEVRKGNGLREVWYKTSIDGGNTWSESVNITSQVHRPNQPNSNPAYHFKEGWRSYANTPGHAMQFEEGKYKGRIYIAANHSAGDPQQHSTDYDAHGFYTDDHGKTFHLSQPLRVPGSNEATAAALSNNKLMLNARNQKGDIRARIVAISSNGGETWDSTYFDYNLPDPVCEGSLLAIGKKKGKSVLAFCNAADTKNRDNLTLRISFDEGKTWAISKVIDKAAQPKASHAAYSDIVKLSKDKIGILYEKDDYAQIVFTAVPLTK
ncbi:MAG: sialidase family protein [Spirosomataceae bacterium]